MWTVAESKVLSFEIQEKQNERKKKQDAEVAPLIKAFFFFSLYIYMCAFIKYKQTQELIKWITMNITRPQVRLVIHL